MPRYFSGFIELGSRTTEAGPKNSRELWWWFITSSELWWITQVQLQVQKKYHRSYYYHSTIVEFIDSKEIPGTPNSRTPTPMVLPYHSYKNPLKYGNGLEACGILLCIESWIEHPRPKIIHAWSFVPWKLPGSFLLVLGIFTTFLRKSLRGWSSHFWSSLCDCIPYSCDQKLFRNPAYGEAPLGWSVGKTFQCIGCLDPLEKVQICASYQIANWTNWTKCWTNSTWQLSDNNQLW